MPTTSQIPPHDFEQLYADVKEKKDTAVVITLSSRLSGTFQSANIALMVMKIVLRSLTAKMYVLANRFL